MIAEPAVAGQQYDERDEEQRRADGDDPAGVHLDRWRLHEFALRHGSDPIR
jgi:hypothetical protein